VAVLVGVLVVGLAAVAWWRYRRVRRIVVAATAAAFLWLLQAVLGGLVVKYGLTPGLVTAHLATATLFVGALVYATVASFSVAISISERPDRITKLLWATAAAVFALIIVGGLVRGEGAGLAFPDWPLMGGSLFPSIGGLRPALMFIHRLLAALVGILVLATAVRTWAVRRTRTPASVLALAAVGFFLAQILIGAANVWTRLAPAAVVGHVAVSSLIFGTLVGAAAASRACACKEARDGARGLTERALAVTGEGTR
jgi:heme A synthase